MSIRPLPRGVIKQISSAQVINSVSSAVKELFENALDAGATVIDIKLERNGLDRIEIRDNGSGISVTDINFVCLPHCTSKIRTLSDLERLQSYGFRGEALHSLCALSQLSITTKTEHDDVASTYIFDNNGTVLDVKSSHQMNGTVITATNLFRNVPVRKQFYESTRKAAEELKKVEKVVKHLSIIHSKLRVTLAHNRCLIWHKTSVYNLRQSLMQVYPSAVLKNLKDVRYDFENVSIEMLIANRDCNLPVLLQPVNEAVLLYINQRSVKDKKIEKVVFEEMSHLYASVLPVNKCPLTLLSLSLSPESLDVNLEPNKTKVFIKDHEEILKNVREAIMRHFYQPPCTSDMETLFLDDEDVRNPAKKQKLQENSNLSVSDDLNVSEMRNIIIEKTKFDSEMASKKLSDINLSFLNQSKTWLSGSENEKFDGISHLKNDTDLNLVSNDGSLIPSTTDVFTSTSAIEKTKLLIEDNANELNKMPRDDLLDSTTSPFVCDDSTKECEKVNLEHSSFPNGSVLKRQPAEELEDNVSKVTFHLEDNRNTKSNEFNSDRLFPIFSNENRTKESGISKPIADSITLSQWSKGHVAILNEPLEGGVVLFDNSNISECGETEKKEFRKETKQTCISHDDTERHISSRFAYKNVSSSITNFAQQVRSKITKTKEVPKMSFGVLARELASRWSELRDDRKKANAEDSFIMKRRPTSDLRPKETFKKKTLLLNISANKILEELKMPGRICRRSKKNKITLIGPLETSTRWLYEVNDTVSVVDVGHLQENVILHRYTCNSSISLQRLDEPIEISSQILGQDLWNFLSTLDRISDGDDESISIIADSRITKNGFKVIVRKSYNSSEVFITEIAEEAVFDVVDNFVETLKLAVRFEELEHCRSEKTKTTLLKKVTEVCEQKMVPKNAIEIRMMLQYWVQCMLQKKICPHDEPISVNLHQL